MKIMLMKILSINKSVQRDYIRFTPDLQQIFFDIVHGTIDEKKLKNIFPGTVNHPPNTKVIKTSYPLSRLIFKMSAADIETLITALEERLVERIKKNHKEIKAAFALLEEKCTATAETSTKGSKAAKADKPKREQSEGQKEWTNFIKEVWDELKADNPKATYKEAMTEASSRKNASDPEGAKKRQEAKEKRAAAKAAKSGSSSGKASKNDSDSEEEVKPKKTVKKTVKKPVAEDSDEE